MLAATSVENVVNAFAIIGREANYQDVYSRRKWRKHTTEQSRDSWKHTPSEFPISQLKGGKNCKQNLTGTVCLKIGQTK